MTLVQAFTVNPFAENTYVVYDDSGECIILDPGCYTSTEREQLRQFILEKNLRPVRLINTHCHLDHVFGNQFVNQTWQLGLEIHRGELPTLERYPRPARYMVLLTPRSVRHRCGSLNQAKPSHLATHN